MMSEQSKDMSTVMRVVTENVPRCVQLYDPLFRAILIVYLSLTLAGCVTVINHRLGPRSIQSEY